MRQLGRRLGIVGALALVGTAAILAWLGRMPAAASAEAHARLQYRALIYAIYILATIGVPYLFRVWCASPDRSCWPGDAYAVALLPPLMLLVGGAWIGRHGPLAPGDEAVLLPGAALLLGYSLVLAAACDLGRVISAGAGQLLPTFLGVLALGSVLIGGPAVENAPDEQSRQRRIGWLVDVNPLIVASERMPAHHPLRGLLYEETPIGAYYVYVKPPWRTSLTRYGLLTAILAAAASVLRMLIDLFGVKPEDRAADNQDRSVTTEGLLT